MHIEQVTKACREGNLNALAQMRLDRSHERAAYLAEIYHISLTVVAPTQRMLDALAAMAAAVIRPPHATADDILAAYGNGCTAELGCFAQHADQPECKKAADYLLKAWYAEDVNTVSKYERQAAALLGSVRVWK